MTGFSGDHAAVIGGSVAGLWAARVLADHFERVTVIERDHFPNEPVPRKGLPQGRHVHILLGRGQRILEQLFPGLSEELVAAGIPRVEFGHQTRSMISTGRWLQRYHTGDFVITPSRDTLEYAMRQRLRQNPRITFLEGVSAAGLVSDGAGRVTGVQLQGVGVGRTDAPHPLDANLVVDASGRTSRAPEWLQALGYAAPEETVVNAFLGYATRWYKRPANFNGYWHWMTVQGNPNGNRRGGVIFGVEGDRWVVTVAGVLRDYPPTDDDGFNTFLQSLQTPEFYEAIRQAEPLGPIYGYQRTENRWRHYERLPRWLDNFVILGDAVCGFNPVYGQGMTSSGMAALELDACLRDAARKGTMIGMAQRFQQRLAKVLQTPWLMATGEDFRYPETEGQRPGFSSRFVQWYLDRVIMLLPDSQRLSNTFSQVAQLIRPPTALFQPWIIWKVLTYRPQKPAQPEMTSQPHAVSD